MPFLLALLKVLPQHPLRGLAALYWYVTRRRVRARNRLRLLQEQDPAFYQTWIREVEEPLLPGHADAATGPRLSVLLWSDPAAGAEACEHSIASVMAQSGDWELIVVPGGPVAAPLPSHPRLRQLAPAADAATALQAAIEAASSDYVLPLRAGDRLARTALCRLREALGESPRADVLYGDDDEIDARGRRARPYFKPEWNEEMFLAQDYLSAACLIRREVALDALPVRAPLAGVATYALLLRLLALDADRAIVHVPHVLCHRANRHADALPELRRAAVAAHLQDIGSSATAHQATFGAVRVCWPLPADPPLVSIIVPTRDKVRLLRACLRGVLEHTRYPNIEVLVVDNGSVQASTHRYLARLQGDPRVRVLSYPGAYNYSAINNFAVAAARGSYVCLLNNDTETLREDWLCELMRQAVRPHVGAVGAKLLYGDRSIQHGGVIVGLGDLAGHPHRFLRNDRPGYFNHPHLPQYMSAVTAACLVVEKRKYLHVGGLDEACLAIAFNDVDLCLKLGAAGWQNVYTPWAVLVHHESKSRRSDRAASEQPRYRQEAATLQERWGTRDYRDPCHHPFLSRRSETFQIAADLRDHAASGGCGPARQRRVGPRRSVRRASASARAAS